MKYLFPLIMMTALTASAFQINDKGYRIKGTVTGLTEGTWLYLRTATPDKDIDSCQVRNGTFSMQGQVREQAVRVYLHTARYTDYVSFWLENAPIQIAVKSGAFKSGSITGSRTEDENKQLDKLREPLKKQADSLGRALAATTDEKLQEVLKAQLTATRSQSKQLDRDYIRAHPSSLVAADLLNVYASTWGRDTAAALYQLMAQDIKSTRYGKEIADFINLNRNLKVGSCYADFVQANTAGKPVSLSGIKGKYILLDFWASWCGPCRQENPRLVKTFEKYKDKGFAVLGVSLDNIKAAWLKAVAMDHLAWENVSDLRGDKNKAALIYGINAIPNNFLIDANGIIIATNLRGQELDSKLEELLK